MISSTKVFPQTDEAVFLKLDPQAFSGLPADGRARLRIEGNVEITAKLDTPSSVSLDQGFLSHFIRTRMYFVVCIPAAKSRTRTSQMPGLSFAAMSSFSVNSPRAAP